MNDGIFLGAWGILLFEILLPVLKKDVLPVKNDKIKFNGNFARMVIFFLAGAGTLSYIISYILINGINFIHSIEDVQYSFKILLVIFFVFFIVGEGIIFMVWKKSDSKVSIRISMSPNDYKELILTAEKDAKTIWLMPRKIHGMFKSDAFIQYLAEKRFGTGSEYTATYIEEHISRKAALKNGLLKGMVIRELHNRNDLIDYINQRAHTGVTNIEKEYFIEMLNEWKKTLECQQTYYVRLTDENIPIKYELIDKHKMIINASVGSHSHYRLNAILIESPVIVEKISTDFSQIWENMLGGQRDNFSVIDFIDNELLPILTNGEKNK